MQNTDVLNPVKSFVFREQTLRPVEDQDIPQIRTLVNKAYQELADLGLNYTATYQDEKITRERITKGRAFALEKEGQIIGTVLLTQENYFTGLKSAYVSQLAVLPELKKSGLGTLLMNLCETIARNEGFDSIQLDTAKPAKHLVSWYLRLGYQIVGATQWEGKTYESWVFEKSLLTNQ